MSAMKKYDHLLYSAIGLAALFLLLVALNFLVARGGVPPLDLTQGKLYTLSPGTKKVLQNLPGKVRVKLYASRGESVPVPLRGFTQRVADLVNEMKKEARGNLEVENLDPRPDSEIEDAAQLDGIEPQQLASGESFYLGVAVSQLDRKQAIGSISPQRERLLEYDLVRAIARVGSAERPKVGLMAGLPVTGERFNPMTRQSSEPWVLANELKREFDVKEIGMGAREIDKDINVLLLIHPRDIQPRTEYLLDQFVLRGGKLIAFVDPYAYFDQQPVMPGMPGMASSSTLPLLFKAWGVEMNPGKVVSDVVFGSGGGSRYTPTVLSLNRTAFSRDDVVTSSIEVILYPFGGAFDVKTPDWLKVTPLLRASPNSMLVDNADATKSGDEATRKFQPSGKALPLALRLTGTFRTAFPEGLVVDKKTIAGTPELKEATKENSVILVADVDLLADGAAVDVQEVFGRRIVVPSNGNLALALGMVEQFAAGDDLISLRSRAASFRPLTVVRELEAEAQKQYFGKIQALEEEKQKTVARLQELQKSQGAAGKSAQILSPEQQAELERFKKTLLETNLALKEVRKNLRQDAEGLVFWTKVANIALMPLAVALFGLLLFLFRRRKVA
jgi:ABC-type uncharacterized transport system involved in gliding motility auxiliary subunit